jgi:hypothetical protein
MTAIRMNPILSYATRPVAQNLRFGSKLDVLKAKYNPSGPTEIAKICAQEIRLKDGRSFKVIDCLKDIAEHGPQTLSTLLMGLPISNQETECLRTQLLEHLARPHGILSIGMSGHEDEYRLTDTGRELVRSWFTPPRS